ncbi:MAG: alcohol dehydrogenase, propanol-preferring [Rhodospirillaceae bacterium]|nr:alcohol dehydrogenase, propanol-preferring [Rhodospirillaceae bacterium]
MRAMQFHAPGQPLRSADCRDPQPGEGEVLVKVEACGVCRTDLHLVDGELESCKRPVVPGHEIVGSVVANGERAERFAPGDRVGIPWLGWTCGRCRFCLSGHENLCDQARFTGCQIDGGYAELTVADERYCFALPAAYGDSAAAPLLCAGLIGYRAYHMVDEARLIGIYGFGAAAHIIAQVARHRGNRIFAFTRDGDVEGQQFARELGAEWAGGSGSMPPEPLDAALIFAPVGALVPAALRATVKGGTVVCAGIHMSDIPSFPYRILWEERTVRSVANLTRRDGEEFLGLAAELPIRTHTQAFPLTDANLALTRLRQGQVRGAAVLIP